MPINAGTATPTFRLGTATVSRMHLGTAVVYDASGSGGGGVSSLLSSPLDVKLVSADNSLGASWRMPSGHFTKAVQTQVSSNGGASWTSVSASSATQSLDASQRSIILSVGGTSNLAANTAYLFRVRLSHYGEGSDWVQAGPATPATTPSQVAAPSAFVEDGTVVVAWAEPTDRGGATPSEIIYILEYKSATATADSWVTVRNIVGSRTERLAAREFTPLGVYSFRVSSKPKAGSALTSAASNASSTVTAPAFPPNSPLVVGLWAYANGILVEWTAATNNGSAITAYKIYTKSGTSGYALAATVAGTATSADITGLTNGTAYTVAVTAVNAAGESAYGTILTGSESRTPLAGYPGQVASFAAAAVSPSGSGSAALFSQVDLSWSSTPFADYQPTFWLELREAGQSAWQPYWQPFVDAGFRPATIPDPQWLFTTWPKGGFRMSWLRPAKTYSFRIFEIKNGLMGRPVYASVTTSG
jgi:hypothetical protein